MEDNEHPGTLLARSVCKLSSDIANRLDENNQVTSEESNKLLVDMVTNFNQEMAKKGYITQGAFDILLMTVASYSLLERKIMEKSGRSVDTPSRRDIIQKAFKMISTGETLSGKKLSDTQPEVEVESDPTSSGTSED